MWNLQRTATGQFHLEDTINIEDLNAENISMHLMPIEKIFQGNTKITVDDRFIKFLLNGVIVKDKALVSKFQENITYSVYNSDNNFIGIADKSSEGIRLIKSFI